MPESLTLEQFIKGIPKAELHLHIEGTFEPELMFQIATRNSIPIKYSSVDELRNAYNFNNLQEFLNIYYEGAGVLTTEQDFYDMTWAYFTKVHAENVLHAEIFFDPQTHTARGISFATVINGIHRACEDAKTEYGITTKLIMCFLRHMDEESAFDTLESAIPFKSLIHGIGLDSAEVGNPPSKFKRVYDKAHHLGFITVAHAGEEGPAEYVWDALNNLRIARLDHGNRALEDEILVKEIAQRQIALTVCPLSNLKLCVVDDLVKHPLKKMLDANILATVNSDDPAYFGGYINENYLQTAKALKLTKEDIYRLARNSFQGSFLHDGEKERYLSAVDAFWNAHK
jgi:adenosine deaminase